MTKKEMDKARHRKIKFYFNRHLRRFGDTKERRDTNTIRNVFSVESHLAIRSAQKFGGWVLV